MDIVFTALILLASLDILSKYGNLICLNFRDIALKIAQKKFLSFYPRLGSKTLLSKKVEFLYIISGYERK